jgi:hypothetical protein
MDLEDTDMSTKKRGRPPKVKPAPIVEDVVEFAEEDEICPILDMLAIKTCRNPTMLEGCVNGEKVVVIVPKRIRDRLIGKTIQVQETPEGYIYIP